MNYHEYRAGMEHQHGVIRKADKQLRYTLVAALVWEGVAIWFVLKLMEVLWTLL